MDINRIESAALWHDRLDLIDPFYGNVADLRALAETAPCASLKEWLMENIEKMPQRQANLTAPAAEFSVLVCDDDKCSGCNANCCNGIFCIRD